MIVILGGVFICWVQQNPYVKVVEAATVIEEPQTVLIEEVIEWTPKRIEREVLAVFPDAPVMLRVMRCEGGYDIDAYNPTNNSHDKGLFQVSMKYHGQRVERLGLDMNDPKDNLKFARILYDESGLQPWSASKHCWE